MKKKVLLLCIGCLMAASAWAQSYSGGDGSKEHPYQIATKADMMELANDVNIGNSQEGVCFLLTADVEGISTVIGEASAHPFRGTFDGDGYTLTVTIDITGPFAGVFGYARGATIRNLEVAGTVTATGPTGGAVAGGICANMVEGTIHNCRNTGAIASQGALIAYAGGICGVADASSVSNCYNGGEISATATSSAHSGGICGVAEASPVSNSYNTGAVAAVSSSSEDTKASYAGGICGWVSAATAPSASIRNCYNTGDIASTASAAAAAYAGGICASGSSLVIDNGYNTGRISSDADTSSATAGGICGSLTSSPSSINNCFAAHASIRATGSSSSAGRVAGRIFNATLTNNYAWENMSVDGNTEVSPDATGKDGANATMAQFKNIDWLTDRLHWTVNDWYLPDDASFPVLRVFVAYSGGAGTAAAPYLITSVADMERLATAVDRGEVGADAHFRLMADVEGVTTIVGFDAGRPFKGTFDGNGHRLTVDIRTTTPCAGVFGYAVGAVIRNLGVAGTVTATAEGNPVYAGGICGYLREGEVAMCYNRASIGTTASYPAYYSSFAGGICGNAFKSSIRNCRNTGPVAATASGDGHPTAYAGGICGQAAEESPVSHCYNTGMVTATAITEATEYSVAFSGGMVGQILSDIRNCYNVGAVTATATATAGADAESYAGGIGGRVQSAAASVGYCYNTGEVSAASTASGRAATWSGGMGGEVYHAAIENCFAANAGVTATATANETRVNTGRMAGSSNGARSNNYALSGMLVNGERRTGTDAAGIDGCDKEIAWFQTFAHLEDVLKWDMETTWFVPDGAYPELQVNPALWLTLSATAVAYGDQPVRMFPFDSSVLYTSSNAAVAEVVDDLVYIRGAGRVMIRAFRAGTETDPPARAGAVLTIGKAPLTITADPVSRRYGEANPSVAFSYSSFAYDETEEVLTDPPTARFDATADTPVGASAIWPAGAAADNYDISYNAGTLTIHKASLTVTAVDASRAYGEANPAFAVSYAGFKNGETEEVLTERPVATTVATATSPVGDYAITVSGGRAVNYAFDCFPGTLTVLPVYAIHLPSTAGGVVTAEPSATSIAGASVALRIAPENGYALSDIGVRGTAAPYTRIPLSGEGEVRTFVMPAEGVTVSASFHKTADRLALEEAVRRLGNTSFVVSQETLNTRDAVFTWLLDTLNVWLADLNMAVPTRNLWLYNFSSAVAGTPPLPAGRDGGFAATVSLSKNGNYATVYVYGAILATRYVPVGIERPEVGALTAYVRNGMLYVSGQTVGEAWEVYDISGKRVYQGAAAAVPLAVRGVYVVRTGTCSVRVVY